MQESYTCSEYLILPGGPEERTEYSGPVCFDTFEPHRFHSLSCRPRDELKLRAAEGAGNKRTRSRYTETKAAQTQKASL